MSLYIDMKMILTVKCSGSHCRSVIRLNLLEDAPRCDSWEHLPLELRGHTVDSIHILEVIVFRIPFNFALPDRNRIISDFSNTEHRVGEDVGCGVGDLISLFTQ